MGIAPLFRIVALFRAGVCWTTAGGQCFRHDLVMRDATLLVVSLTIANGRSGMVLLSNLVHAVIIEVVGSFTRLGPCSCSDLFVGLEPVSFVELLVAAWRGCRNIAASTLRIGHVHQHIDAVARRLPSATI